MPANAFKKLLKEYKNVMYKHPTEDSGLDSGDVVLLDRKFFEKFSRSRSILPLIRQFLKDPNYKSHYWALLNKSCDMVHDQKTKRVFDSSLFLCPLKNFITLFGPNELLSDCVCKESSDQQTPYKKIHSLYEDFASRHIRKELPFDKTLPKDKKIVLQKTIEKSKEAMLSYFREIISDESIEYEFVFPQLKKWLKEETMSREALVALEDFVKEHEFSNRWKKFQETMEDQEKRKGSITIKNDKIKKLTKFFCNQNDSDGHFFYEPSELLSSSSSGLCFFIKLSDMVTLKTKKEFQEDGSLEKYLRENRKLKLNPIFSGRLLNILGNYFSKIGTPDIGAFPILNIYSEMLGDKFEVRTGNPFGK